MTLSPCIGQTDCDQNGWDFADVFRFQFKIVKSANAPCSNWRTEAAGKYFVHHCPDLPCSELQDAKGNRVGVVLGYAVDRNGELLSGTTKVSSIEALADLEAYIERLAGRFVVVVSAFKTDRVYFDPTAGLSAVLSEKDGGLASSVHLLLDREIAPQTAVDVADVLERNAQFVLGETCDAQCRRVYANHYVDLESLSLMRHWPKPDVSFENERFTRDEAATGISARLSQIMAGLAKGTSVSLPLSSGTDSRILLAASMGVLDQIDAYYVHNMYSVTRFDLQGAQMLADTVGIDLTVIDGKSAAFHDVMTQGEEDELRQKMALRTSLSFNGIDGPTTRAVSLTPQTNLVMRGNVAEMTRANKWTHATARVGATTRDGLAALLNMRAEHLEERVEPDRLAALSARYDAWAATLPERAQSRLPDMAHAEVFMPSAPNNVYNAFTRNFYINPFNDRQLLELTAWFPPLARRRRKLVNKIIGQTAPNLANLPYLKELKEQARASA